MHMPEPKRFPPDKSAGRATAQLLQRSLSFEKRAMQALQTGSDGQQRQTAHWLGSSRDKLEKGFCKSCLNTMSAYHCLTGASRNSEFRDEVQGARSAGHRNALVCMRIPSTAQRGNSPDK
jgi:hypothetical protein